MGETKTYYIAVCGSCGHEFDGEYPWQLKAMRSEDHCPECDSHNILGKERTETVVRPRKVKKGKPAIRFSPERSEAVKEWQEAFADVKSAKGWRQKKYLQTIALREEGERVPFDGHSGTAFHKLPQTHRKAITQRADRVGAVENGTLTERGREILAWFARGGHDECGAKLLPAAFKKQAGGRWSTTTQTVPGWECPRCSGSR